MIILKNLNVEAKMICFNRINSKQSLSLKRNDEETNSRQRKYLKGIIIPKIGLMEFSINGNKLKFAVDIASLGSISNQL